jgi:hypothetical protein
MDDLASTDMSMIYKRLLHLYLGKYQYPETALAWHRA